VPSKTVSRVVILLVKGAFRADPVSPLAAGELLIGYDYRQIIPRKFWNDASTMKRAEPSDLVGAVGDEVELPSHSL
jgi:hypothetical protein